MNEGPTAYFNTDAIEYLHDIYPKRCTGPGGPFPWPAHKPDPNPLRLFRPEDISDILCMGLQQGDRIQTEYGTIQQTFDHVRESVVSRAAGCAMKSEIVTLNSCCSC